jgi:hypothetical protein
MAERDRYDWERGRDYERDRGYGRGYDRERGYDDRGMVSRGADEVRSWFGDDEARRRREMDEQRDRERGWTDSGERDWRSGPNSERSRSEHGWGESRSSQDWDRSRSQSSSDRDRFERQRYGGSSTYGFGAPNWSGAPSRETGGWRSDYNEPTYPHSYGGGQNYGASSAGAFGGFAAGQPSPSFAGGYGAGNYESGSFRSGGSYGRESGFTGEGRWSGQGRFERDYGRGGAFAGRGPRNYQRSDERIREDVNECLTADPRIDASDIDVRVQNCEVTLSGTVDDRRTRRLAEEIIEDLPGVRDVKNELRVHQGQGWGGRSEQTRGREDGSIGNTGDPQKRDDVTTLNQTGKINR